MLHSLTSVVMLAGAVGGFYGEEAAAAAAKRWRRYDSQRQARGEGKLALAGRIAKKKGRGLGGDPVLRLSPRSSRAGGLSRLGWWVPPCLCYPGMLLAAPVSLSPAAGSHSISIQQRDGRAQRSSF